MAMGIEYLPGWTAFEAEGCCKVEGVVLECYGAGNVPNLFVGDEILTTGVTIRGMGPSRSGASSSPPASSSTASICPAADSTGAPSST